MAFSPLEPSVGVQWTFGCGTGTDPTWHSVQGKGHTCQPVSASPANVSAEIWWFFQQV